MNQTCDIIQKKAATATKWSTATEITVKMIQPISNMVLARLLLPEAFAAVATINMVVSFADIFTDAGFQKYVIQNEFSSETEKNKAVNVAFWTNLCISILLWLIIFCFRNSIAVMVGSPDLGLGIGIASLSLLMTSFSSLQMALFKRSFDFRTLFFSRIVGAVIPFIITIPLAYAGMGFWALIIGTLCGRVFDAVYLTIKSSWKPAFVYSFRTLKQMFSFSIWTLVESITVWLTVWIGVFIVGHTMNDYYSGLYSTAINTVNSIMSIVVSASVSVLFATLSRLQNDEKAYNAMFLKYQKMVALFVIPMGIGIFVYQEEITLLLLGKQWMEASCLVGIWGLCYSVSIIFGNLISEVYRSKGKPKLSVLAQLLHIVVLAPVCYISSNIGFECLAYARSLSRLEFVLVHFILLFIVTKITPLKMLKNMLPNIISACVMGLFGFGILMIFDSLWIRYASIVLSIVVYFGVLYIFPEERDMIKKMISRLTSRFEFKHNKGEK